MGNRTAKFLSALVGSIIAGAPLAAVSQNAPSAPTSTANAASDCLASPKGTAPQGQHWFYRLERSTKRQCWYLRAEGAKAATTAQAANSTSQPDSPPPQSVQDARAEYIAPQSSAAQAAPPATQPAPAASSEPQQPAVATRWPDSTAAAAAPASQPAAAPAAAQPSVQPAPAPAPVALAAADSADKPTGSLPTLLLVIVSALALAGVIASVIYRFAGGGVRVQTADRRVHWDQHRQDHDDSRAPWHAEPVPAQRVERPRPVDFDAVRPHTTQIAAFTDDIRRIAAQDRPREIAAIEPDAIEVDYVDGEFEIEAPAPQLAADDIHDAEPAEHAADAQDDDARDDNTVDIDIITAMLERLAAEGPRLSQPSLEADLAALARIQRGQSAARA